MILRASTSRLTEDWRRPRGRPCQSWLRTAKADLIKPLDFASMQHVGVLPIVPPGAVSCCLTGEPTRDDGDESYSLLKTLTLTFDMIEGDRQPGSYSRRWIDAIRKCCGKDLRRAASTDDKRQSCMAKVCDYIDLTISDNHGTRRRRRRRRKARIKKKKKSYNDR